uniref:Uncharacterized protein TCIL3000_10_3500 n=1 Tax=Trypanosoma congolense (strain IL3000) TaxID=1068625 RepID=G0UW23_TRYCI|nr:unnamed protein product [Trypanosoma congolense IL3000]
MTPCPGLLHFLPPSCYSVEIPSAQICFFSVADPAVRCSCHTLVLVSSRVSLWISPSESNSQPLSVYSRYFSYSHSAPRDVSLFGCFFLVLMHVPVCEHFFQNVFLVLPYIKEKKQESPLKIFLVEWKIQTYLRSDLCDAVLQKPHLFLHRLGLRHLTELSSKRPFTDPFSKPLTCPLPLSRSSRDAFSMGFLIVAKTHCLSKI